MKRFLLFFLALILSAVPALADPLILLDDYSNMVSVQYDGTDPVAGRFEYVYRYPHVDDNGEGGSAINAFYAAQADYQESFSIPLNRDALWGQDTKIVIDYSVTLNSSDYLSVLVRREKTVAGRTETVWEGHVFSRRHPDPGSTYTLPRLLGVLDADENEEWVMEYQISRANDAVRNLVWEMMQDNDTDVDYDRDYTREYLSEDFNPEQDYYLDENGDPVFYINPGIAAPESAGLIIFPIPLEDILDEL